MMLFLTVLLGVAGLRPAAGRPQSSYFITPDYTEVVESLPLATEPPPEPGDTLSQRRRAEKELVLKGIRSYILASLDMPCTPVAPPSNALSSAERNNLVRLVSNMQNRPDGYSQSGLIKRAQSFYPSCDHPAEEDPRVSRLMPSLDVYFNLTSFFPTVTDDVIIERAELRVYKIPSRSSRRRGRRLTPTGHDQEVRISLHAYTSPSNSSSRPGDPAGPADVTPWSDDVTPWSDDVTPWSNDVTPWSNDVTPWSNDVTPWSNDVSPWSSSDYQRGAASDVTPWSHDITPSSNDLAPWSDVSRPSSVFSGGSSGSSGAQRDQHGPRLVDRLTVSSSRRGWLTFDVMSAVRAWKLGADNWGFLLTVEDLSGGQLPPDDFFQDMECDVAVPSSPVPGVLVQVAQDSALEMQPEPRYPVLDLVTATPAADMLPAEAPDGSDRPCPTPAGPPRRPSAFVRRHHRPGRRQR